MRRIIAAILAICLVFAPFPAFSFVADQEGTKPRVIASGTVAANLLRFSNATGAYFVDTTDATLAAALAAAVKHNDTIEVLDGSKRAIRFAAKSQGTGETLGVSIVNNPELTINATGITGSNATVTRVDSEVDPGSNSGGADKYAAKIVRSTTSGYAIAALTGQAEGALYLTSARYYNTVASIAFRISINGAVDGTVKNAWAAISKYVTISTGGNSLFLQLASNGSIGDTYYVDKILSQQVLTPSTSGVFAAKYPGGADGFSLVAASFDYNSATGFTWRVISSTPNGRTVYSNAITSSAMHASMANGTAFFFHDSIDFSSFAVGPSGKYLIAMYDSAGRVAWGYGKAAGGGETLSGIERFRDPSFGDTTKWNKGTGWDVAGGNATKTAGTASLLADGGATGSTVGQLIKRTIEISSVSAGEVSFPYDETGGMLSTPTQAAGTYSRYWTSINTSSVRSMYATALSNAVLASVSVQQVLTPPVTGLTITSTPDGATYNWAQITTGFDANAVASIKVWRAL